MNLRELLQEKIPKQKTGNWWPLIFKTGLGVPAKQVFKMTIKYLNFLSKEIENARWVYFGTQLFSIVLLFWVSSIIKISITPGPAHTPPLGQDIDMYSMMEI